MAVTAISFGCGGTFRLGSVRLDLQKDGLPAAALGSKSRRHITGQGHQRTHQFQANARRSASQGRERAPSDAEGMKRRVSRLAAGRTAVAAGALVVAGRTFSRGGVEGNASSTNGDAGGAITRRLAHRLPTIGTAFAPAAGIKPGPREANHIERKAA